MDKAVEDLTTVYVPQFAAFLAGATGLPEDALTTPHHRPRAHDQGGRGCPGRGDDCRGGRAADLPRRQHMQMIGDPLAAAIVAALPASFQ